MNHEEFRKSARALYEFTNSRKKAIEQCNAEAHALEQLRIALVGADEAVTYLETAEATLARFQSETRDMQAALDAVKTKHTEAEEQRRQTVSKVEQATNELAGLQAQLTEAKATIARAERLQAAFDQTGAAK